MPSAPRTTRTPASRAATTPAAHTAPPTASRAAVAPTSQAHRTPASRAARRRTPLIPRHALLTCTPFGPRLSAERVAAALATGLTEAGAPAPDRCPFQEAPDDLPAALAGLELDARMLRSRAVVIAVAHLQPSTLAGSLPFEIATRARQSGVPCYAVAARNELDAFDARVMDLQIVLRASGTSALRSAGSKLAALLSVGSPGTGT